MAIRGHNIMKINDEGLALVKEFEGCRLTAYKCPAGVLTIGYGHTGKVNGKNIYLGMKINEKTAEQLLKQDLATFEKAVENCIGLTFKPNSNQFSALVSFAFNCGAANLKTLVKGRSATTVAEKLLLYNKANGKELSGLTRRRKAERELFLKPCETTDTTEQEESEVKMPTIKKNSTGKAVAIWQVIVGAEPDGVFGNDTEKATEEFQKKHGLKVDGIVGEKSWAVGFDTI